MHRTLTSASNTDALLLKSKILVEINGNLVRPDKDVVGTEEITGEKLRQRLDEALRAGQGGGKAGRSIRRLAGRREVRMMRRASSLDEHSDTRASTDLHDTETVHCFYLLRLSPDR